MSARHAAHTAPATPARAPVDGAPSPGAPAKAAGVQGAAGGGGGRSTEAAVQDAGHGALAWWNEHIGPYAAVTHAQDGLRLVARHTGVPVVLVAALALVLSWRLARRLTRLALEVSLAAVLVLALTRLGLITW